MTCDLMSGLAAFTALGFLLLHTFSMVIAFNALAGDKRSHQLFVPVMHLCAALLVQTPSPFFSLSHISSTYLFGFSASVVFKMVIGRAS